MQKMRLLIDAAPHFLNVQLYLLIFACSEVSLSIVLAEQLTAIASQEPWRQRSADSRVARAAQQPPVLATVDGCDPYSARLSQNVCVVSISPPSNVYSLVCAFAEKE